MACWTLALTAESKARQETTLERLEKALGAGTMKVKIGASGAVAFEGNAVSLEDDGLVDVCAYRRLLAKNSPALRKAIMKAEAMSGRKVDPRAIAAGVHSHDGGKTWGAH